MEFHEPVLLKEVIDALHVSPNKVYIDGTVGNGGHSQKIIELGGIVYGMDRDPQNLKIASDRLNSSNFFPINDNFVNIPKIDKHIDGVLLDLGLSSGQQKSVGRGFSFNDSLSLDMRLDPDQQDETAENIINTYPYEKLYEIFTKIAQEQYAKPLIIRIISERQKEPIRSGTRLASIIRDYFSEKHLRSNIDPSTKIFMALRIIVNHEYENLKKFLENSLKFNKDCTVAIITFHSGEDRIVKQFIRSHFPSSPKPIKPTLAEIKSNPLSRSATLRSYRIL